VTLIISHLLSFEGVAHECIVLWKGGIVAYRTRLHAVVVIALVLSFLPAAVVAALAAHFVVFIFAKFVKVGGDGFNQKIAARGVELLILLW